MKTAEQNHNILNCSSYDKLYESFLHLYPELKKSVKEWAKDGFTAKRRSVLVTLNNGIRIRFVAQKCGEDKKYAYIGYLNLSEATMAKYKVVAAEDGDGA